MIAQLKEGKSLKEVFFNNKRWPLHPPPHRGESLLSWLMRISALYNIDAKELLFYTFKMQLDSRELSFISLNPPGLLLKRLSDYTGINFDDIKALTASSYVPLFIDTLDESKAKIFHYYANQFQFFPGKRKNNNYIMNYWIPWFNIERFTNYQGCETCLSQPEGPYIRLYWQFPWIMTCPTHKTLLKPFMLYKSFLQDQLKYSFRSEQEKDVPHSLDELYIMDGMTLDALITGFVKLPSGNLLHGGIWLRLLRTLLAELSYPVVVFNQEPLNLITSFWQNLGLPRRYGLVRYKVYEQLDYEQQLLLMIVAASVVKDVLNKPNFSSEAVKILSR